MLVTNVVYFDAPVTCACDMKCEKAWGLSTRPREQLSDDINDVVWLSDSELGEAPTDPGTYEGACAKPFHPKEHNKWCVRECERLALAKHGTQPELVDWSARVYNQPWKHGDGGNAV